MIWFWFVIGVLVWIACGVVSFGATLADFQERFKEIAIIERRNHLHVAWVMRFAGPFGLLGTRISL